MRGAWLNGSQQYCDFSDLSSISKNELKHIYKMLHLSRQKMRLLPLSTKSIQTNSQNSYIYFKDPPLEIKMSKGSVINSRNRSPVRISIILFRNILATSGAAAAAFLVLKFH